MSSMKSGFSTLNRWLGKKNKDKNAPNGKLSKSNTNLSSLSVSSININETSQLEYNRITPLPAATSNAPFEQTFRITVLLPKDQLYVARLGARVPLSKLLELVCDNKLLDAQKYEFRNPVDPSQVYSCDLTIGAVGLSEIRLCHKSESYDTFNTDEVIKLHRTTIIRDSLSSSSEFSSRNSKLTTKTPSPYSSSNSLNSLDSTGMNYTRTPVTPPAALTAVSAAGLTASQKQLAAPPRKKRAAPRPPSQTAIPEKSALVITTTTTTTTATTTVKTESNNNNNSSSPVAALPTLTRRDVCASTPNLTTPTHEMTAKIDCNGNNKQLSNGYANATNNNNNNNHNSSHNEDNSDEEMLALRKLEAQRNTRNSYIGSSVQTLYASASANADANSDEHDASGLNLPEPSPRKRMLQLKKKVAPAPPPRGAGMADDSISIASTTVSLTERNTEAELSSAHDEDESPKPTKREQTTKVSPADVREEVRPELPKPVPRSTTTTLLNTSEAMPQATATVTLAATPAVATTSNNNVSKVLLNRTPTPEPRSLTSEPSMEEAQTSEVEDDNVSKQADSGIGEPVPSPLPDSLPSESSTQDQKSNFESSSDDDDATVKVYNFKLGKTAVLPTLANGHHQPTLEELAQLASAETDSSAAQTPNDSLLETPTPNSNAGTEVTSWNFAIPILTPPPNFADNATDTTMTTEAPTESPASPTPAVNSDAPIKPKIKARPVLNFETFVELDASQASQSPPTPQVKPPPKPSTPQSKPSTPMNEIVDELSAIIQENRMDMLIKKNKSTDQSGNGGCGNGQIEAAKPNTLANFSIAAASSTSSNTSSTTTTTSSTSTKVERTEVTTAVATVAPESPGSEREKLYRRTSSSAQQQQQQQQRRRSVTRADSFQTAAKLSETLNGLLNRRSSSQLSLTKLEQNGLQLNRRRSSSELSIGESPTLQSPEVIKSILGSRKNSLANISDGETQERQQQTWLEKPPAVAEKPKNVTAKAVEYNGTSNNNNNHNNTKAATLPTPEVVASTVMQETTTATAKPPKEVPKTYRYSGPPSINFSTWNERPKVQVSIKNEGDYIFGSKHASRQSALVTNSSNNNSGGGQLDEVKATHESQSTVASVTAAEKLTIEAAAPTLRMGIPRKEYKVPITVKPLRDVTVETATPATPQPKSQTQVEVTKSNNNKTTIEIVARESTEGGGGGSIVTLRQPTTTTSATLPRHNNNNNNNTSRFTMPAATLRSTSITQLKPTTRDVKAETEAAPFGQGTLRRTGFKEKMLAKEQQEQERAIRNSAAIVVTNGGPQKSMPSPTATPTAAVGPTKTVIKSAKLELKLQHNNNNNNTASSPPPPPTAVSQATVVLKSSVTLNRTTVPSPPVPPPPAPALHGLKPVVARTPTTPSPTADTRSQLLDAIRNFKREELNRT